MDSGRTKVASGVNGNRNDIAPRRKWLGKIAREAKRFFGMFLYLWVLLGLFDSMNLRSLQTTKIDFAGYDFAFVNALILAKVMLVAGDLDIARGFEDKPLVYPVL